MKIILLWAVFTALALLFYVTPDFEAAAAEMTYELGEVLITPEASDERRAAIAGRHYTEIGVPAENTQYDVFYLLARSSAIDLVRRGPLGVQADLRMRGATFEQTDIVLDGIRLNDPQTGHFNLDLPIAMEDIDRIRVAGGPSAADYGAGPGGSVHITTRKPEGKGAAWKTVFGAHGYLGNSLSVTYPGGALNSRSTLWAVSSDGYRDNTDFNVIGFSQVTAGKTGIGDALLGAHYLDKKFGANGFYSEFYPHQWEETQTLLMRLILDTAINDVWVRPRIFLRRHDDRFVLDRTNPPLSENFHRNYLSGMAVDAGAEYGPGYLELRGEFAGEKIDSTNLERHSRLRGTAAARYGAGARFFYGLGAAVYGYEGVKGRLVPDVSCGYRLGESVKLRCAAGGSFRAPTFTELYYRSPANTGNENLSPETSRNYEIGADYLREALSGKLTVFFRREKNLIDWVRRESETVYQAANAAAVDTRGMELNVQCAPEKLDPLLSGWQSLSLGYSRVRRDKKPDDLVSKYVFDYLEHKFVLSGEHRLPFALVNRVCLRYLERVDRAGDVIVDNTVTKPFASGAVFFTAENLFNRSYAEKSNIPMPGRRLFAGMRREW